jgi:predicted MFS family arabinose efflux permease
MTAPVPMWRAFALFACAYTLSYALRAVNAAIGPEVAREFQLDAAFLGGMTAAYFATFALIQIPLGKWLDQFGAVRTECALLLMAAAGCMVFALAPGTAWLIAGRALIGAGVAACLMAAFKAYRTWFAPHLQGRLASWMLFAGTLGALLAASPAQWLTQQTGWRAVFGLAALALVLAAAGLWWGLPRAMPQAANAPPAMPLLEVLRQRAVLRFAPAAVFAAGGFIAVQTLWLGPWLRTVYGMAPGAAAAVLTVMNATMLAGFLLLGAAGPWLAQRTRWLTAITFGAFTCNGVLMVLAAAGGAALHWSIWAAIGLCFTAQPLAQSRVTLAFAPAQAGRVSTATNLLLFGGAFVLQWGMGLAIDLLQATGLSAALSMQWTFGALGVAIVVAGVWGLCMGGDE